MHNLVRAQRHDVFLDQHLDAVRRGLEETERTDPIRPDPILDPRENFPLEERHEREEGEKNREKRDDVEEAGDGLPEPGRRLRERGEQPTFRQDKNLIEKSGHAAAKQSEECSRRQAGNRSDRKG